jgi:hypothetical protein
MATRVSAPAIEPDQPRPLTGAERQAAYRQRKKASTALVPATGPNEPVEPAPVTLRYVTSAPVMERTSPPVRSIAPLALRAAALGLAAVGLSMNATYARSLGNGDLSGWLFLALGLSADCAALALPSVAASAWRLGERTTAAAAWMTWAVVFAFALLGSVGFASVSISDVTMARAGRVTPQVVTAQAALTDSMSSRDRECKGGVGRFCRERENAVAAARAGLDAAMGAVASTSDPQTAAMVRLVSWASRGAVAPSPDDVGMIRLALLALLPQIGGVLLMIARAK